MPGLRRHLRASLPRVSMTNGNFPRKRPDRIHRKHQGRRKPMRVFVAGATGVLGRALTPLLLAAGHEMIGLARTPEKLLQLDRMGALTARGDVLDAPGIRTLVQNARPDAMVNLATSIPLKLRIDPKDWEHNDRIRVEGTSNLLAAGQEAGV